LETLELVDLVRNPEKWDVLEEFMAENILEKRGINPWGKEWDALVPVKVDREEEVGYLRIALWVLLLTHLLTVLLNGIRLLAESKWVTSSELMVAMVWGVLVAGIAFIRLGYVRKLQGVVVIRPREIRLWVVIGTGFLSFILALIASFRSGVSPFGNW
jgi:hypothetical protein